MSGECFFHEGRAAAARCRQCGRPVCADCLRKTADGSFCGDQCATAGAAFELRKEELSGRPEPRRRSLVRVILKTIFILALALLAMHFALPLLKR